MVLTQQIVASTAVHRQEIATTTYKWVPMVLDGVGVHLVHAKLGILGRYPAVLASSMVVSLATQ